MRQIEFHRDDRYEYHRAVEFDEIVIIFAFETGAGNIQRQFAQGGIARDRAHVEFQRVYVVCERIALHHFARVLRRARAAVRGIYLFGNITFRAVAQIDREKDLIHRVARKFFQRSFCGTDIRA